MPSPGHRPRSSSASLARATHALRKGDISISDPIPSSFTWTVSSPSGRSDQYQDRPLIQQVDGTWPRQSAGVHSPNLSTSQPMMYDSRCVSMGPSIVPSNMSTAPSKTSLNASQKKTGGLRATIRRMFGSKKNRASISEHRRDYYRSVSYFPKPAAGLISCSALSSSHDCRARQGFCLLKGQDGTIRTLYRLVAESDGHLCIVLPSLLYILFWNATDQNSCRTLAT